MASNETVPATGAISVSDLRATNVNDTATLDEVTPLVDGGTDGDNSPPPPTAPEPTACSIRAIIESEVGNEGTMPPVSAVAVEDAHTQEHCGDMHLVVASSSSLPAGLGMLTGGPATDALLSEPSMELRHQALDGVVAIAPSGSSIPGGVPIAPTSAPSLAKRKRKQYANDEERRTARILKNRRTAEESRQRRLKRMRELEANAAAAQAREKELMDTIEQLRATVAEQASRIRNFECIRQQTSGEIDSPTTPGRNGVGGDNGVEEHNIEVKRLKLRK